MKIFKIIPIGMITCGFLMSVLGLGLMISGLTIEIMFL